jgi:hypothetical protein
MVVMKGVRCGRSLLGSSETAVKVLEEGADYGSNFVSWVVAG